MKKLIVLGILATMLMAMGVVAQAAVPAWVISIAATSDQAATVGQSYSSIGLSTKTTDQVADFSTGAYDPTKSEVDYTGNTTVGAATYVPSVERVQSFKASTSDAGAPSASTATTWFLQAVNNNADTPMYVTAWNLSTAQYNIPASLGYAVTMYELTGANGTPILSSAYSFTNGTTKAANGTFVANIGVGGAFSQWTIPAGVNNVAYFEIVASNVPEPGSLVALFSGFVGLVGFGIRRRK